MATKATKATKVPTEALRYYFVYDEDAQFEECNEPEIAP